MAETYSIASVTVAYNGAGVLRRHLDSIKRQSRRLDEIIVVNNASGDDTGKLLSSEYPEITLLDMPENVGVGGGFSAGLAYAAGKKKHDWVWLFDQDSVPADNGLELLLAGLQHLDGAAANTAIMAPRCVNSATSMVYPGLIWRHGWRYIDLDAQIQAVVPIDSVISSGTLLKSETIEKVGLPRSDFFMDFVDHEYCFRLRRAGYGIAIVTASRLDHEIGDARLVEFFGLSKKWADHIPWREYYMARNEVFTIWKYYPDWRSKLSTLIRLAHHGFDLLLYGRGKFACFGMMVRGIGDGWGGRMGVRKFGRAKH